jgi:hypothetical protein
MHRVSVSRCLGLEIQLRISPNYLNAFTCKWQSWKSIFKDCLNIKNTDVLISGIWLTDCYFSSGIVYCTLSHLIPRRHDPSKLTLSHTWASDARRLTSCQEGLTYQEWHCRRHRHTAIQFDGWISFAEACVCYVSKIGQQKKIIYTPPPGMIPK